MNEIKTNYKYAKETLKEYNKEEFAKIMKYNFRLTEQRNYIYSFDDFCLYYKVDKYNIISVINAYTNSIGDYQDINNYISYLLNGNDIIRYDNYIYSNRFMIYGFILSILTSNIRIKSDIKILYKGIKKFEHSELYPYDKEIKKSELNIEDKKDLTNIKTNIELLYDKYKDNEELINCFKKLNTDILKQFILKHYLDFLNKNIKEEFDCKDINSDLRYLNKNNNNKNIQNYFGFNGIEKYITNKTNKYYEMKKYFDLRMINNIFNNTKLWSTTYNTEIKNNTAIKFLNNDRENKAQDLSQNKNILFKINLTEDCFGLIINKEDFEFGAAVDEEEILLPPNNEFKVKNIDKSKIKINGNMKIPYVEIELDIISKKKITDMKYIHCFREIVNNLHLNIELTDEQFNCINEYFKELYMS